MESLFIQQRRLAAYVKKPILVDFQDNRSRGQAAG